MTQWGYRVPATKHSSSALVLCIGHHFGSIIGAWEEPWPGARGLRVIPSFAVTLLFLDVHVNSTWSSLAHLNRLPVCHKKQIEGSDHLWQGIPFYSSLHSVILPESFSGFCMNYNPKNPPWNNVVGISETLKDLSIFIVFSSRKCTYHTLKVTSVLQLWQLGV